MEFDEYNLQIRLTGRKIKFPLLALTDRIPPDKAGYFKQVQYLSVDSVNRTALEGGGRT